MKYYVREIILWEFGTHQTMFDGDYDDFAEKFGIKKWNKKNLANKIWDFWMETQGDEPEVMEALEKPEYWNMLAMDIALDDGTGYITMLGYDWTSSRGFVLHKK